MIFMGKEVKVFFRVHWVTEDGFSQYCDYDNMENVKIELERHFDSHMEIKVI